MLDKLGAAMSYLMQFDKDEEGDAPKVGQFTQQSMAPHIDQFKMLPDGKMYHNIAEKVVEPTLTNNYELVSGYSEQVQAVLNQNASIGIKAQKAELNYDRIEGIINKISAAEQYDDVAWVLDEPVKTFTQSIVYDTIKKNAEFQYKSGLNPTIKRKLAGGCCEWCAEVAGTYSYPDVPKDVYRRHQRCRCTVIYDPADGKKIQGVHGKGEYDSEREARIGEAEHNAALDKRKSEIQKELRKCIGLEINGTKITSFSKHVVERIIKRDIDTDNIFDTLKNPLKIGETKVDRYERKSFTAIGKWCTISVNPDTGVVPSAWPTSPRRRNKLMAD